MTDGRYLELDGITYLESSVRRPFLGFQIWNWLKND
jgi:hypothetical protein